MKQIVVLSGKGGTGKTTVAAALAPLVRRERALVLADADVDASNLELLLAPRVCEEHPFMAGQVAVIDDAVCEACGTCRDTCRFDAVEFPGEDRPGNAYRIDPIACEGCAACMHLCPAEAIRMDPLQSGLWFRSDTRYGPLFHARLFAGRENSGKLVTLIKQRARDAAIAAGDSLLLVDGPPGIGCPVISALSGADLAVIVTEPTIAGVHDLERVLEVSDHFGVPSAVAINKADLSPANSGKIERFCRDRAVPLLGRIPYDPEVTDSMIRGVPATESGNNALSGALKATWDAVGGLLREPKRLKVESRWAT
jgi:MinD superfamily P-loop ATPase